MFSLWLIWPLVVKSSLCHHVFHIARTSVPWSLRATLLPTSVIITHTHTHTHTQHISLSLSLIHNTHTHTYKFCSPSFFFFFFFFVVKAFLLRCASCSRYASTSDNYRHKEPYIFSFLSWIYDLSYSYFFSFLLNSKGVFEVSKPKLLVAVEFTNWGPHALAWP